MIKRYRSAKYAKGVRAIMEVGSSPVFVGDQFVESIRSRMLDRAISLTKEQPRSGQIVRIVRGPLEGIEAEFERNLNGLQNVSLLLCAISDQTPLSSIQILFVISKSGGLYLQTLFCPLRKVVLCDSEDKNERQ